MRAGLQRLLIATTLVACSAACALLTNLDGLSGDAGPTCDAAPSCVANVGAPWTPVTLTLAGCAPGWTERTLYQNAHLNDGGCACGACSVVGQYTCDAQVPFLVGAACTNPGGDATPGKCIDIPAAQHIEVPPVTAGSSGVKCVVQEAGTGASADELRICVPGCTSDYCGAANRCVMAPGTLACPTGFTLYGAAGTAVDPGCGGCNCSLSGAPSCTGTVTAYDSPACSGTQSSYPLGTCNLSTTTLQSLVVDLVAPSGACIVSAPSTAGDASVVDVQTICCQ